MRATTVMVSALACVLIGLAGGRASGDHLRTGELQETDVTRFPIIAEGKITTYDSMIAALAKADVVVIGENHDDKHAHMLELSVLTAMFAQNPRLALSMEMFERDVQGVVDEYLAGYITETSFLQASRPWPNYKSDYRPLVEFCREHKLPVIAANAPRRYVNMVSRSGPEALGRLPKSSRGNLAPLPYSTEIPAGYREQLNEVFGGAHSGGAAQPAPAGMPSADHLIQAQGLWDATMQDSILSFHKRHRGVRILQVNGGMHSDRRFGLVDRLRLADPRLKMVVISAKPDARFPNPVAESYQGVADFVVVTPQAKAEAASR